MSDQNKELKQFAEAMLDLDRLKIVGALGRGMRTAAALAQETGMELTPVREHLAMLAAAGLVTIEDAQDSEPNYRLNEPALEKMSERQFHRARSLRAAEADHRPIGESFTAEEQKFIRSFTDREGIIKHLPSTSRKPKLIAVLKYAMQDLEPGRIYTESAFNQALARFTRDASSVRRELVDQGFVERKADGSAYWLVEDRDDR